MDGRAEGALAQLPVLRPRLILVEDNDGDAAFAVRLAEILRENPNVGVIRLSLSNNQLSIYSARQVTATGTGDLVNAIQDLARCSREDEPQREQPAAQ